MKNYEIQIRESICKQMNVDVNETLKTTRVRKVSEARQMFVLWLRRKTDYTLKEIGSMVRNVPYDHTTIIHSCQVMENLIDTDDKLREIWQSLDRVSAITFTSLKYKP